MWGDPCCNRHGENDLLSPSNSPVHEVRPIIKIEIITGLQGGQRNHNQTPTLIRFRWQICKSSMAISEVKLKIYGKFVYLEETESY